jgi:hypothetical protein
MPAPAAMQNGGATPKTPSMDSKEVHKRLLRLDADIRRTCEKLSALQNAQVALAETGRTKSINILGQSSVTATLDFGKGSRLGVGTNSPKKVPNSERVGGWQSGIFAPTPPAELKEVPSVSTPFGTQAHVEEQKGMSPLQIPEGDGFMHIQKHTKSPLSPTGKQPSPYATDDNNANYAPGAPHRFHYQHSASPALSTQPFADDDHDEEILKKEGKITFQVQRAQTMSVDTLLRPDIETATVETEAPPGETATLDTREINTTNGQKHHWMSNRHRPAPFACEDGMEDQVATPPSGSTNSKRFECSPPRNSAPWPTEYGGEIVQKRKDTHFATNSSKCVGALLDEDSPAPPIAPGARTPGLEGCKHKRALHHQVSDDDFSGGGGMIFAEESVAAPTALVAVTAVETRMARRHFQAPASQVVESSQKDHLGAGVAIAEVISTAAAAAAAAAEAPPTLKSLHETDHLGPGVDMAGKGSPNTVHHTSIVRMGSGEVCVEEARVDPRVDHFGSHVAPTIAAVSELAAAADTAVSELTAPAVSELTAASLAAASLAAAAGEVATTVDSPASAAGMASGRVSPTLSVASCSSWSSFSSSVSGPVSGPAARRHHRRSRPKPSPSTPGRVANTDPHSTARRNSFRHSSSLMLVDQSFIDSQPN